MVGHARAGVEFKKLGLRIGRLIVPEDIDPGPALTVEGLKGLAAQGLHQVGKLRRNRRRAFVACRIAKILVLVVVVALGCHDFNDIQCTHRAPGLLQQAHRKLPTRNKGLNNNGVIKMACLGNGLGKLVFGFNFCKAKRGALAGGLDRQGKAQGLNQLNGGGVIGLSKGWRWDAMGHPDAFCDELIHSKGRCHDTRARIGNTQ